jgi:transposase InsO family protein
MVVLTGTRTNKLYRLEMKVDSPRSQANAVVVESGPNTPAHSSLTSSESGSGKRLDLWHHRFGHVNNAMLIHMHAHGTVQGMELASHTLPTSPCEGCAIGKNSRQPFPKQRSSPRATKPGQFFYTDICGPMSQNSIGGARYFILFKDDHSRYCFIFCVKNKSDVFDKFKILREMFVQQIGNRIEKIRSDRGGEYLSKEFTKYLADASIRHDLTSPYTPEQNGGAERENRTLVECIRTMLHAKRLNLCLWGEALQIAAYVLNRSSSRTRGYKTPYELWTGNRPSVEHFRVFGNVAYAHVPKEKRTKLEPKSIKTIFVGYCLDSKAYWLWDNKKRRIIISRDVIFDEYSLPSQATTDAFSGLFSLQSVSSTASSNHNSGISESSHEIPVPDSPRGDSDQDEDNSGHKGDTSLPEPEPRPLSPRPVRMRGAPTRFKDYYVPHTFAGIVSSMRIPEDPENYAAAMRSPEAMEWQQAMAAEYESLMKNGTWRLVPLPRDRKAVACKWVYRVKTNSDGSVAKFKARLVTKEFIQTQGVDYDQTFSPVVKYESIRTVLALAAQQGMYLTQFDIQTAYLNGVIDTTIYMLQPPGFETKGKDDEVLVCLVLKSLYGLKQSSRIWNKTFDNFLVKFELEPSEADPCVYISKTEPSLIVTLFVDNGLACCASQSKLDAMILHME